MTGARKGDRKAKFWDALAYSRVVAWGRDYFNSYYYVIQNELESLGVWSRTLKKWQAGGPVWIGRSPKPP